MSTAAALTELQKDIQKKKLPSLLDRKFEKVAGCDNEEGDFSVMQWNVLAQGRVIFVVCNVLSHNLNKKINSMSVMLKIPPPHQIVYFRKKHKNLHMQIHV